MDLRSSASSRGWACLIAPASAAGIAAGSLAAVMLLETGPWTPVLYALAGMAAAAAVATACVFRILLPRRDRARTEIAALRTRAREAEDVLSLVLKAGRESLAGWHWETGPDGRLKAVSEGLAAGLGRPQQELVGTRFAELFAPGEAGPGWHRLVLAVEALKPVSCAVELPVGGARTWWQVTCHPVAGASATATGTRGYARNISAERTARNRVLGRLMAAEDASRRKSQFLAAMAAEMRNALNTIIGFTEHLLSTAGDEAGRAGLRCHLQTMLTSGQQLQNIVNITTDAVRLETRQFRLIEQEADAAEVTEIAVKKCRDVAERAGVTLVASLIDGIELRCDVARLTQSLVAIISVAAAWSPPGATVAIDFELPGQGGLTVTVAAAAASLPTARPDDLFEPFGAPIPGTPDRSGLAGLGLPIARQIALLHAGDVTVEATAPGGVVFRLLLPAGRVMAVAGASQTLFPAA